MKEEGEGGGGMEEVGREGGPGKEGKGGRGVGEIRQMTWHLLV